MAGLLHAIEFDEEFGYEVTKDEHLYRVQVKRVKLNPDARLVGNLSLDELFREKIQKTTHLLGRPLFPTPGYNPVYTDTKEKRENVCSIKDVVLGVSDEEFKRNINLKLLKKYGSIMDHLEITNFFGRINENYRFVSLG